MTSCRFVLSSISLYDMSLFLMPSSVSLERDYLLWNFFWEGKGGSNTHTHTHIYNEKQ